MKKMQQIQGIPILTGLQLVARFTLARRDLNLCPREPLCTDRTHQYRYTSSNFFGCLLPPLSYMCMLFFFLLLLSPSLSSLSSSSFPKSLLRSLTSSFTLPTKWPRKMTPLYSCVYFAEALPPVSCEAQQFSDLHTIVLNGGGFSTRLACEYLGGLEFKATAGPTGLITEANILIENAMIQSTFLVAEGVRLGLGTVFTIRNSSITNLAKVRLYQQLVENAVLAFHGNTVRFNGLANDGRLIVWGGVTTSISSRAMLSITENAIYDSPSYATGELLQVSVTGSTQFANQTAPVIIAFNTFECYTFCFSVGGSVNASFTGNTVTALAGNLMAYTLLSSILSYGFVLWSGTNSVQDGYVFNLVYAGRTPVAALGPSRVYLNETHPAMVAITCPKAPLSDRVLGDSLFNLSFISTEKRGNGSSASSLDFGVSAINPFPLSSLKVLLYGSRWHSDLSLVLSNNTYVPTYNSASRSNGSVYVDTENATLVDLQRITVEGKATFTINSRSKIVVSNNNFSCLLLDPTLTSSPFGGDAWTPALLIENNRFRDSLACAVSSVYYGLRIKWIRQSGGAVAFASINRNTFEVQEMVGGAYRALSFSSEAKGSPSATIVINDNNVSAGAGWPIETSLRNVDLCFQRNKLQTAGNGTLYSISASLHESRVQWDDTNELIAPAAAFKINHLSQPRNDSYVSIRNKVVGALEYTIQGQETSANSTLVVRNVQCWGNLNVRLGKSIFSRISIDGLITMSTSVLSSLQGEDLSQFEYTSNSHAFGLQLTISVVGASLSSEGWSAKNENTLIRIFNVSVLGGIDSAWSFTAPPYTAVVIEDCVLTETSIELTTSNAFFMSQQQTKINFVGNTVVSSNKRDMTATGIPRGPIGLWFVWKRRAFAAVPVDEPPPLVTVANNSFFFKYGVTSPTTRCFVLISNGTSYENASINIANNTFSSGAGYGATLIISHADVSLERNTFINKGAGTLSVTLSSARITFDESNVVSVGAGGISVVHVEAPRPGNVFIVKGLSVSGSVQYLVSGVAAPPPAAAAALTCDRVALLGVNASAVAVNLHKSYSLVYSEVTVWGVRALSSRSVIYVGHMYDSFVRVQYSEFMRGVDIAASPNATNATLQFTNNKASQSTTMAIGGCAGWTVVRGNAFATVVSTNGSLSLFLRLGGAPLVNVVRNTMTASAVANGVALTAKCEAYTVAGQSLLQLEKNATVFFEGNVLTGSGAGVSTISTCMGAGVVRNNVVGPPGSGLDVVVGAASTLHWSPREMNALVNTSLHFRVLAGALALDLDLDGGSYAALSLTSLSPSNGSRIRARVAGVSLGALTFSVDAGSVFLIEVLNSTVAGEASVAVAGTPTVPGRAPGPLLLRVMLLWCRFEGGLSVSVAKAGVAMAYSNLSAISIGACTIDTRLNLEIVTTVPYTLYNSTITTATTNFSSITGRVDSSFGEIHRNTFLLGMGSDPSKVYVRIAVAGPVNTPAGTFRGTIVSRNVFRIAFRLEGSAFIAYGRVLLISNLFFFSVVMSSTPSMWLHVVGNQFPPMDLMALTFASGMMQVNTLVSGCNTQGGEGSLNITALSFRGFDTRFAEVACGMGAVFGSCLGLLPSSTVQDHGTHEPCMYSTTMAIGDCVVPRVDPLDTNLAGLTCSEKGALELLLPSIAAATAAQYSNQASLSVREAAWWSGGRCPKNPAYYWGELVWPPPLIPITKSLSLSLVDPVSSTTKSLMVPTTRTRSLSLAASVTVKGAEEPVSLTRTTWTGTQRLLLPSRSITVSLIEEPTGPPTANRSTLAPIPPPPGRPSLSEAAGGEAAGQSVSSLTAVSAVMANPVTMLQLDAVGSVMGMAACTDGSLIPPLSTADGSDKRDDGRQPKGLGSNHGSNLSTTTAPAQRPPSRSSEEARRPYDFSNNPFHLFIGPEGGAAERGSLLTCVLIMVAGTVAVAVYSIWSATRKNDDNNNNNINRPGVTAYPRIPFTSIPLLLSFPSILLTPAAFTIRLAVRSAVRLALFSTDDGDVALAAVAFFVVAAYIAHVFSCLLLSPVASPSPSTTHHDDAAPYFRPAGLVCYAAAVPATGVDGAVLPRWHRWLEGFVGPSCIWMERPREGKVAGAKERMGKTQSDRLRSGVRDDDDDDERVVPTTGDEAQLEDMLLGGEDATPDPPEDDELVSSAPSLVVNAWLNRYERYITKSRGVSWFGAFQLLTTAVLKALSSAETRASCLHRNDAGWNLAVLSNALLLVCCTVNTANAVRELQVFTNIVVWLTYVVLGVSGIGTVLAVARLVVNTFPKRVFGTSAPPPPVPLRLDNGKHSRQTRGAISGSSAADQHLRRGFGSGGGALFTISFFGFEIGIGAGSSAAVIRTHGRGHDGERYENEKARTQTASLSRRDAFPILIVRDLASNPNDEADDDVELDLLGLPPRDVNGDSKESETKEEEEEMLPDTLSCNGNNSNSNSNDGALSSSEKRAVSALVEELALYEARLGAGLEKLK